MPKLERYKNTYDTTVRESGFNSVQLAFGVAREDNGDSVKLWLRVGRFTIELGHFPSQYDA